jgi:hypothetical protein
MQRQLQVMKASPQSDPFESTELPPGWQSAIDPVSRKIYYFNLATGVRQWDRPHERRDDTIQEDAVMGVPDFPDDNFLISDDELSYNGDGGEPTVSEMTPTDSEMQRQLQVMEASLQSDPFESTAQGSLIVMAPESSVSKIDPQHTEVGGTVSRIEPQHTEVESMVGMQDVVAGPPEPSSVGILPELLGILPVTEAEEQQCGGALEPQAEPAHVTTGQLKAPFPSQEAQFPTQNWAATCGTVDYDDWDSPVQSPRDPVFVGEGPGDEANSWDGSDDEGAPKQF